MGEGGGRELPSTIIFGRPCSLSFPRRRWSWGKEEDGPRSSSVVPSRPSFPHTVVGHRGRRRTGDGNSPPRLLSSPFVPPRTLSPLFVLWSPASSSVTPSPPAFPHLVVGRGEPGRQTTVGKGSTLSLVSLPLLCSPDRRRWAGRSPPHRRSFPLVPHSPLVVGRPSSFSVPLSSSVVGQGGGGVSIVGKDPCRRRLSLLLLRFRSERRRCWENSPLPPRRRSSLLLVLHDVRWLPNPDDKPKLTRPMSNCIVNLTTSSNREQTNLFLSF